MDWVAKTQLEGGAAPSQPCTTSISYVQMGFFSSVRPSFCYKYAPMILESDLPVINRPATITLPYSDDVKGRCEPGPYKGKASLQDVHDPRC